MDPVFGCRGVIAHLQSQIARGVAEINDVRQQLVQLRMAAHQQQQRQQQQQQQYVTMGYDQPMMPQKQPLEGVPMGYDGSIERERSSAAMGRPRNAQEDQNHGVLETEQIVELHMTAQQQKQQQQQQQQYVTMGCDQQMMPQHQQQPLEFLKEMGCDQQMMQQQQQQQQQYVTMGCDLQMMPQHQQQPPLEGVTMGRPRSAQEDQNHGVLETEVWFLFSLFLSFFSWVFVLEYFLWILCF
ncbi:hypothetical protein QJS04_geneDACA017889 [Acorus gramineus]|uniref:LOB domain-containing protein n=1 Tax=Acorus gramineus TaxID=55184 RepID=A0AAV9AN15_ACOGR|nr:hypothetical protein QJS04_geneDACA017889 [Acorus gramineus]